MIDEDDVRALGIIIKARAKIVGKMYTKGGSIPTEGPIAEFLTETKALLDSYPEEVQTAAKLRAEQHIKT